MPAVNGDSDAFRRTADSVYVQKIAEAGHMVPYEQPEALAREVTAFLG